MKMPSSSVVLSGSNRNPRIRSWPSVDQENGFRYLRRSAMLKKSQRQCSIGMAFLVVINLLLEIASAVTDQLSSIHKPYLARISLLMSILSVILFIGELAHKIEHHKVQFKCKRPIPWFYYPSGGYNRMFGSLLETVLLFCVVGQLIVSTINCGFIQRGRDSPIKISLWPLFFAIGMAISKLKDFGVNLSLEVQPKESL